jgi:hypothetical protein
LIGAEPVLGRRTLQALGDDLPLRIVGGDPRREERARHEDEETGEARHGEVASAEEAIHS